MGYDDTRATQEVEYYHQPVTTNIEVNNSREVNSGSPAKDHHIETQIDHRANEI